MTARTTGEDVGTGAGPQRPPRSSELRRPDEIAPAREVDAREVDAIEGGEALEGDRPVHPAIDTSAVTRTRQTAVSAHPTDDDPLFGQDAAADFRARWDRVQRSFVDDPQQAVKAGDELVSEVIQALSRTFTEQRSGFEKDANPDQPSTESLRLALRRYRSFFERLLTI